MIWAEWRATRDPRRMRIMRKITRPTRDIKQNQGELNIAGQWLRERERERERERALNIVGLRLWDLQNK